MTRASGNETNVSKERKVTLPGIGTAIQLPSGEVRVQYPDGTQLWVDGKHHVRYQYSDGHLSTYSDTDNIPRQIMEKVQQMPKILKHLMPVVHKTKTIR